MKSIQCFEKQDTFINKRLADTFDIYKESECCLHYLFCKMITILFYGDTSIIKILHTKTSCLQRKYVSVIFYCFNDVAFNVQLTLKEVFFDFLVLQNVMLLS